MSETAPMMLTAASGIGALGSAFGQYQAGQYNSDVARFNERIARMQARDAWERGLEAVGRHRQSVRKLIGSQRAALAAQGVDVNDGSALAVQQDTIALGEQDALTIRNNAAREAWGFRVQAAGYRSAAGMARREGMFGAAGTILGGAVQTYDIGKGLGVF